jgi:hypothetical protein
MGGRPFDDARLVWSRGTNGCDGTQPFPVEGRRRVRSHRALDEPPGDGPCDTARTGQPRPPEKRPAPQPPPRRPPA